MGIQGKTIAVDHNLSLNVPENPHSAIIPFIEDDGIGADLRLAEKLVVVVRA